MEFSAAVFKNPVQSGRFIGQDWRRFSPWVQYLMPMDYRSHYAGDFETHLDLLAESIQQQKVWARDFAHFWPGVAAYQLYDEEREPLDPDAEAPARRGPGRGRDAGGLRQGRAAARDLRARPPRRDRGVPEGRRRTPRTRPRSSTPSSRTCRRATTRRSGITKTLERVRAQEVEGVVIFSTGGITSARLWEAVGEFFGK